MGIPIGVLGAFQGLGVGLQAVAGLVQQPRTRHPDFYVVNTAQFASNTLNNNEVIRSVNAFLEQFEPEFRSAA